MFTTLARWAGLEVPREGGIDALDQRAFFEGKQKASSREGFPYCLGPTLYGVKWRNFKLVLVKQERLTDPALSPPNPHLINLDTDPKEREPVSYPYLHTWVGVHVGKILSDYHDSLKREPLIPLGTPLDFVPGATHINSTMSASGRLATVRPSARNCWESQALLLANERAYRQLFARQKGSKRCAKRCWR